MTRLAVVTGGTRGIGLAISRALRADGFNVVALYAQNDDAARACAESSDVKVMRADVGNYEDCQTAVARIEADSGPIDVLVNNAGITRDALFHKMTQSQWSEVTRVNLDSVFNVTRPVIESMRQREWGRIINVSSINGQKGQAGQTNYSAAKAGMIGFTKALAQENARKGVTVNCVCPGYIDTEMVRSVPEPVLEKIVGQIPVGRLGQAEEVAGLVAYLASDRAAFMTGAILAINGGQHLVG